MSFLGVGAGEAILIFVLTLMLVGPRRFPEIMRQAGRWYRIGRGFTTEVMRDVRAAVEEIEQEVDAEGELQSVRDLADMRQGLEQDFTDAKREADEATRAAEAAGRDAEAAGREVEAAAEGGQSRPTTTRSSTGASGRPSSRLLRHTRANTEPRRADGSGAQPAAEVSPAEDTTPEDAPASDAAPRAPSETATPREAARPTGRRQPVISETVSADDPFKALEARRAARGTTDGAPPSDEANAS